MKVRGVWYLRNGAEVRFEDGVSEATKKEVQDAFDSGLRDIAKLREIAQS